MSSTPPAPPVSGERHHRVLVLGGGSGGVTTAARLRRASKGLGVGIVESSGVHYCGGAPQKIMYLADAYWRDRGLDRPTRVVGAFAGTVMLGVPEINAALERIVRERGIEMCFRHDLRGVDPEHGDMYLVKRYLPPQLYWHGMLKGRA